MNTVYFWAFTIVTNLTAFAIGWTLGRKLRERDIARLASSLDGWLKGGEK